MRAWRLDPKIDAGPAALALTDLAAWATYFWLGSALLGQPRSLQRYREEMSALRWLYRFVAGALAGLGLLMVLATCTPLISWWTWKLASPWETPRGETLIVLSGALMNDDTLAPGTYWRTVYTERAWRTGAFRRIVVSGAGVAPVMRDFLIQRGAQAEAIVVENESLSTRENALRTARLLANAPGTKALITSDYHMFRARRAFRKAGLEVLPCPIPDALKRYRSWQARWPVFLDLSVETVKIAYYYGRGWI